MADAHESKKRKGRPPLSLSEKKRRKSVRETERSLSRVHLGDQFVRWRALMEELEMSSDTERAKFLLDRAFCAWKEKKPVDASAEQAERQLLDEYRRKLIINSEVIPDPFSLKDGWKGEKAAITEWPSVYITDIATYLKSKTPTEIVHRLMNEYKEGKAYRYFAYNRVKEILLHEIRTNNSYCILRAKVSPSQAVNSKPYDVWVVVRRDTHDTLGGEIINGYCTCTAGMLGSCNHIAGLLFRLEHAVKTGATKPSSTSKACEWNVPPTKTTIKGLKVSDAVREKQKYNKVVSVTDEKEKLKKKRSFTPLSKKEYQDVQDSGLVRSQIHSLLRKEVPDCCFSLLMEKRRHKTEKVVGLLSLLDVAKGIRTEVNEDKFKEMLVEKIRLSDEQITELNNATTEQCQSDVWKRQRQGRLTASLFQRICSRVQTLKSDINADAKPLIHTVMGYKQVFPTKAMKHGISVEPVAKKVYIQNMRHKHQHFECDNSGLFVFKDKPYISASADLAVSCSCCGSGLCEIKCPESIKDQIPSHENVPYIQVDNSGQHNLKRSHPYFYQVQGQMGVMRRKYCDLFIFAFHGNLTIRIKFEEQFWLTILQDLTWFWNKFIVHELTIPSVASEENNVQVADMQSQHATASVSQLNEPVPKSAKARVSQTVSKRRAGYLRKPIYLCGVCTEECLDEPSNYKEESVNCDKCGIWVHLRCARINADNLPTENDEWLCIKCQ